MEHPRLGFHRIGPMRRIPGRRPPVPEPSLMEYHDAQQTLLPGMMQRRLQSWAAPGNEVNPQRDSLFYDGRLPQEVTDLIFEYTLSHEASATLLPRRWPDEERPHDFCVRYDHEKSSDGPETQNTAHVSPTSLEQGGEPVLGQDTVSNRRDLPSHQMRGTLGFDWYRPDAPTKTTCSGWRLLQTCRRVYLDASDFLARNHEAVVYEGRGPRNGHVTDGLSRLLRDNHNHPSYQGIRSMRVYSQMHLLGHMLEMFSPNVFAPRPRMRNRIQNPPDAHWHLRSLLSSGGSPPDPLWRMLHNLETFHLTLRRTDWDRWEDNKALEINPYRDNHLPDVMQRDMHAATVEGESLSFDPRAWGRMFRAMANLKTLTITLETSEDKAPDMEAIVAWARTWRFEIMSWRHWMLEDNDEVMAHLVAEDRPARKMSWRGLWYHWSDQCTACSAPTSEPRAECASCREREALLQEGKGPRILAWTLTWRRKLVDPPVSLEDTETRPETG